MKAGYYITKNTDLVIVYPKGFFQSGFTHLEIITDQEYSLIRFKNSSLKKFGVIVKFNFIGEL